MRKSKSQVLLELLIVFFLFGGMVVSAKLIYDSLGKALKVNPALVEFYRPYLDKNLIKRAAQAIGEKSTSK